MGSSAQTAHELVVRAENRPAERGVSLGHEPDEPVRLRPDLELVPLAAADEDEPRRVRVVAQARNEVRRERDGLWHRPRRLGVGNRAEGELEVAPLVVRTARRNHADDISVAERRPPLDASKLAAAPDERSVDAATVDDRPACSLPLERAVGGATDEPLGIRLEGDVVLGQAPDRHSLPRELEVGELGAVGADDDEACAPHAPIFNRSPIASMDRRLSRSHTRYRPRKVIKGGTMFRLGRMTRRVALLAFVTVLRLRPSSWDRAPRSGPALPTRPPRGASYPGRRSRSTPGRRVSGPAAS